MFSLTLILALVPIILTYIYFKLKFNYWKTRGVPYEEPTIFFGNFLKVALGNDFAGKYIEKLYNKFNSPYFGFYAFDKPYLVIKDPEIIKRVLIRDAHVFPNRVFVCDEELDPYVAYSLLGIKQPQWKALRTKLTPIFSSGQIKMMFPLMNECGKKLEAFMDQVVDQEVEAKSITVKYSTDVIGSCAFGINAGCFDGEDNRFCEAGRKMTSKSFNRYIQSMSYTFAHKLVKLFKFKFFAVEGVAILKSIFLDAIKEREVSKVKRNDLIDILIDLKRQETDSDEFKFHGDNLVAQGVIFFLAGNEAISSLIAFTLHELCINTDMQDRARDEINSVVEKYGGVTYEGILEMEYLNMLVCETLRKYPLTPYLQRECVADYTIPETGLVIEKGVPIIIPQHGLQWDSKYIENPHKYDPERFSKENKRNMANYVYLPFGDGPRRCIGERFGLLDAKLGLVYILKKFTVERNEKTVEPLQFAAAELLQVENGIQVTFRKI